eukprot:521301_1
MSSDWTQATITGYEIITYIASLILIILCIYYNVKLYSYRSEMFMQKRSLFMLFGLNCSTIILMICLIFIMYTMLHRLGSIDNFISVISGFFTLCTFYWFLLVKNWIIWYQYHFTFQSENEWIIHLNSKLATTKNFYIEYNSKLGNKIFMLKLISMPCFMKAIISGTACIYLIQSLQSKVNTITIYLSLTGIAFTVISPMMLYTFLVHKTPSYNDTFYIHWESKKHSKILTIFCIIQIIFCIVIILLNFVSIKIFIMPIQLVLFAMVYISTIGIINKATKYDRLNNNNKINGIKLDTVLSNQDAIQLFINHLSNEYSMECLLALIEITQFQNYVEAHFMDINIETIKDDIYIDKRIQFPASIPISDIIEAKEQNVSNDYLIEAKMKAYKLYTKYIEFGSEFEINISSKQRNTIVNIIKDFDYFIGLNINAEELWKLFEESKYEMIKLLSFSLGRLKQCPDSNTNLSRCFGVH